MRAQFRITAWPLHLALLLMLAVAPAATAQQVVPDDETQWLRWPFSSPPAERHWPRSRSYDLQHVKVEVSFAWEKKEVAGTVTLTLAPLADGLMHLAVDAAEMKVEEVALTRGREPARTLEFSHQGEKLLIVLDRGYAADESLNIAIRYRARPRKGLYFIGPDDAYPDRPRQLWTQGETDYTHYWIPLYDYPNDKATTEIIATVPAEMTTLSNGVLLATRDNRDGTRTFHWKMAVPHSTYLISLVAGRFDKHEDKADGVPLEHYVPPGTDAETVARSFSETGAMVRYFADYTGIPYPYNKYAQVTVTEFLWGGMENTTATTLYTDTLHPEEAVPNFTSEGLVSHELAHQWWGDLLTCRTWADIWLNESFATFFADLWYEQRYGRDEYDYLHFKHAWDYFKEDREEYRRPIVWPVYASQDDLFDSHAYPKGGLVLAMLRAHLGDQLFQKALRHYAKKFSRQAVDTEDFRKAIAEATGKELGWFFEQWLYRAGHPELDVEYAWDPETYSARLTVEQRQERQELTPLFHLPVEVEFLTKQGPQRFQLWLEREQQEFVLPLPEPPARVRFDPDQVLLKTLRFSRSHEELIDLLRNDPNILGRIWAAQQLAAPGDDLAAIGALRQALREEPFYGVRAEIARALGPTRSAAARDVLIATLQDTDARVREKAAEALGEFAGDDKAAAALKSVLAQDSKVYVVAAAAKALGKTRTGAAFEALRAALVRDSHNEAIRRGVFAGLGELGDERGLPLLREWSRYGQPPRAREMAIESMGKLGRPRPGEALDLLLPLLSDPYVFARRAAAKALAELGDPRGLPALEAMAASEIERRVSREAENAVRKIRQAKAKTP